MGKGKMMLEGGKRAEPGQADSFFSSYRSRVAWLKKMRFSSAAFFLVAFLVFAADQLSKLWVVRKFAPGESLALIPNIFHLTYVRNPGAAFGILAYKTSFFIVITFLMILAIVLSGHFLNERYSLLRLALALQLGGSAGNLLDRVKTGYVIDFLDFRIWPVFNLADTALFFGVLLLVISLLGSNLFPAGGKG